MSLAAMALADRIQPFMRYYDQWMRFITGGHDALIREAALRAVRSTDRLLDVGCGTGSLAVAAARRGVRVVGVDHSRPMLALAKEKATRAGVSVEFHDGRLPLLSLPDATFDVVTATFVLSELSRDEAALAIRSMAEVVHPGGLLIIADEALPATLTLRLFSALQRFLVALIAFVLLEKLALTHRHPLRALLEEAGLSVQQDVSYHQGALRLVVAKRPATLPARQRATRPLDAALPHGMVRLALRVAAWFALPIPIASGVYRVGTPDVESPVLLTGNFLATIEALRRALAGRDAYLIVLDSSGWNVWCASDAGLFTAEKAVALLRLYDVERLVSHRQIVIPRLAGRIRPQLVALTHWDVIVGPIEARDLPDFLQQHKISASMRSLDRMYRLPERLRVGALTMAQLPLLLLPLRVLHKPQRRSAWRYAIAASWILPIFHYQLPGRTGIVKSGVVGGAVSLLMLTRGRKRVTRALTVLLTAPYIGWIYQSSSPVIYWKRLWK